MTFDEYKKSRYPYHYYEPIWSSMSMASDVEDAFKVGQSSAEEELTRLRSENEELKEDLEEASALIDQCKVLRERAEKAEAALLSAKREGMMEAADLCKRLAEGSDSTLFTLAVTACEHRIRKAAE